jgi:PIN domain nuclease of toxin-antitoxin system
MEGPLLMRYLLDTATWANNVTMPEVIPERVRKLIAHDDEPKGVAGVSLLECAIHHRLGRLAVRGSLRDFFAVAVAADIEVLDLTPEIACLTNELPKSFPGDPFDRAIVATARALGLTLVTPDPEMRDAGFCLVEYYPFRPSRIKP